MVLFRPFLSPHHSFSWNPELDHADHAFQTSKDAIIRAIREDVEIFNLHRSTCLHPDYSNCGIRYFLLRKHCHCDSIIPDCRIDLHWTTLAGSRFLTSTEQRYAPIRGEALAVTWGLEQTKFFTVGCNHLLVATDHKPLAKIFGNRTLDKISNTHLFRLQRTLPWAFDIVHLPGRSNHAADATSRHPTPAGELFGLTVSDMVEPFFASTIRCRISFQ